MKQAQGSEASSKWSREVGGGGLRGGGVCSEDPQWGILGFGLLKHKKYSFLTQTNNFFLHHAKLNGSLRYATILKYVSDMTK